MKENERSNCIWFTFVLVFISIVASSVITVSYLEQEYENRLQDELAIKLAGFESITYKEEIIVGNEVLQFYEDMFKLEYGTVTLPVIMEIKSDNGKVIDTTIKYKANSCI